MGIRFAFLKTMIFLVSLAHSLGCMASVPLTDEVDYKPISLENTAIPTSYLLAINKTLAPNGLKPLDEQNLGNIPFYWVDQIYINPDFSKSIVLKIGPELVQARYEQKILRYNSSFAYHIRTKNNVPVAFYFTGYFEGSELLELIESIQNVTHHLEISQTQDREFLNKLASFIIPSAEAAGNCGNQAQLPVPNGKIDSIAEAAFNVIFDSLKGCFVSALRGAKNGIVAQLDVVSMVKGVGSAAGAIKDGTVAAAKLVGKGAEAAGKSYIAGVNGAVNLATGWFKDAWTSGLGAANKNAAQKIVRKAGQIVNTVQTGVKTAMTAVTQFVPRIKEFFKSVIKGIEGGIAQLVEHPEVLLKLMCNLVGNLAATSALPALITFLTGGASFGELALNIGQKVGAWSEKLTLLNKVFKMANTMGEAGLKLMLKIADGLENVSKNTLSIIEMMGNHKLGKLAIEASKCAI